MWGEAELVDGRTGDSATERLTRVSVYFTEEREARRRKGGAETEATTWERRIVPMLRKREREKERDTIQGKERIGRRKRKRERERETRTLVHGSSHG